MHDANILRVHEAFRSLVADDDRDIAVIGTSLGGIMTANIVPQEPRIKAVVFIVAGVRLAHILAKSNLPLVTKQRNARMKELGLKTSKDYEDLLTPAIKLEPAHGLASSTSLPPSLHIIAKRDKTVPTASQMRLYKLVPNAEMISLPFAHFGAIVGAGASKKDEILDFIERHVR
jgi:esterase/lipase